MMHASGSGGLRLTSHACMPERAPIHSLFNYASHVAPAVSQPLSSLVSVAVRLTNNKIHWRLRYSLPYRFVTTL